MAKISTEQLRSVAFPAGAASDQDVQRWFDEALRLSGCVLTQRNGGPCGVIASVQGFMLRDLLARGTDFAALDAVSQDTAKEALVEALATILWQARGEAHVVLCNGNVNDDNVHSQELDDLDALKAMLTSDLEAFTQEGGVMLFVYSLILTRTVDKLLNDMDDATQGLTGAFGHCTQELMNLMLCGVAASQVHDGTVDLGGGMVLRGIPERPMVGYLTHLEALRYCQVGTFFKKPLSPVWVIGSDSHYTVLCCSDPKVNEESLRSMQLNRARRAFKEQDQQENGFISIEKVQVVLGKLDLSLSEQEISSFIQKCEMADGAGIVLWNAFWTNVKPLLVPRLDWNCPDCTYYNDKNATNCAMCNKRRTDDVAFDTGEDGEEDDNPHTMDMLHVNGLISTRQGVEQGPTITPFKLTTVSRDLQAPSTHGLGVPMEEVLHTRWPGSVFAFPGDQAPNING